MLKQHYYKKQENEPYIIGIAKGYSEAIDLVSDILIDVWKETDSYDVKAYFEPVLNSCILRNKLGIGY